MVLGGWRRLDEDGEDRNDNKEIRMIIAKLRSIFDLTLL